MVTADPNAVRHAIRVILSLACAIVLTLLFRWVQHGRIVPQSDSPPAPDGEPETPVAVQTLILEVLRTLEQAAALRLVELKVAMQTGLAIVNAPIVLRQALTMAVSGAIDRAAAGFVLVTAEQRDGSLEIAILDDGVRANNATVEATLQPVRQSLALQGGSLQVIGLPGSGTTVVLRLPQPLARRAPPPAWVRHPDAAAVAEPNKAC